MRTSISSLITKTLNHNSNHYIMATKTKQGWLWKDKKHILNSIQYCRDYLQSENIKKGDRIVYKGGNSIEWLSWNIACNSLGTIWVPMYDNQSDDYCNHIVNDCSPKIFISDIKPKLETNIKTIGTNIEYFDEYKDIDFVYNDIATLIYTSGTTGKPKGVMLSNENIVSNINGIQNLFPNFTNKISLNILPWAHIYSQTCELYYSILNENKIALCSSRENFINELKEIQPDVLYVVPRVLELIKSKVEFLDKPILQYVLPIVLKQLFGSNLNIFFIGGAKLQDSTKDFFHKNGYIICEGYGCTELSPIVSINHINDPRNEQSIGKILNNVLVEIIDDEIQVCGPNVMLGYWNNKEETNEEFYYISYDWGFKPWGEWGDIHTLNNGNNLLTWDYIHELEQKLVDSKKASPILQKLQQLKALFPFHDDYEFIQDNMNGEIIKKNVMTTEMINALCMTNNELEAISGNTTSYRYRTNIMNAIALFWD